MLLILVSTKSLLHNKFVNQAGIIIYMRRVVGAIRKIAVLLVGLPVIIVGVILIPLPGPGLLVCLLGLFILSLEFEWAKPYMYKIKSGFKKLIEESKQRQDKINKKYK